MSWSLKDSRKAHLAPKEPPPPPPTYDDSLPLPSFGWMSLDDDDDTPPPGWGGLRTMREAQGLWRTAQLDAFSRLMRRGVDAVRDDPEAETWPRSGHEAPKGYRGGGDRGE